MNTYILVCDQNFGPSSETLLMLRGIDSIKDIKSPFSNFFFLKSPETAVALSKKIIEANPGKRFFISEISQNRQGWLHKDIWVFIKGA